MTGTPGNVVPEATTSVAPADDTSEAVEASENRGGPSRRLVFGIIAIALFMNSVDSTIVATALPAIHHSLRASINWAGWTITIYNLGMVVALPIAGKVSDQFGRRRIFVFGIVLFTVSSLLCGFSSSIYMLIVFRCLQAIGGGAFTPSAAGIVADHFGRDRDRGIGMFGTIAGAGQIVGPILGGIIVGYLSWKWIFFVNVPIGCLLVVLLIKFIPEARLVTSAKKVDLFGLSLTALFVLAAILGITDLGESHAAVYDPRVFVPEVIALLLAAAFIRHTRHSDAPFIPMRLLVDRGFAVMNVQNVLWGVVGFGVASLAPLYAEQRYHFAALDAGTLLTARAVGMILIGGIATFSLRRTGYRLPMTIGFSLVAFGTALMSIAPRWGMSPYLWLSIAAAFCGLGNGGANPATRNALMQLAPDEVAAITGLRLMFIYIGTIFSVAITTAILNRSSDPGITQAHVMWVVVGILVFVMVPLVYRVPDYKGTW